MQNTLLVDSGPLIALFDAGDKWHDRIVEYLRTYHGRLLTTWPVLTEVSHLLDFNLQVQLDFLRWVERGGLEIYPLEQHHLESIIRMMDKYTDIPMDLADATLMYVAHREHLDTILSIDSDFDVYRTLKKGSLRNVLRA